MGAVITNQASHKKEIIGGEAIHPKAVALDACLMVGLPKPITAATGIDALTHGIEAYISTWERGNRTEMGRISVQGVFRWLRMACKEPGNMDAREGMALAAYNAGPSRVVRWAKKEMAVDQWVDSIPFGETREYVQAVLAYLVIYRMRSELHVSLLTAAEREALY